MQEIQTPQIWEEERFQPLVKMKTVYGNPVMAPKMWEEIWETQMYLMECADKSKLYGLNGLSLEIHQLVEIIMDRGKSELTDFLRVMLESYQESSSKTPIHPEEK